MWTKENSTYHWRCHSLVDWSNRHYKEFISGNLYWTYEVVKCLLMFIFKSKMILTNELRLITDWLYRNTTLNIYYLVESLKICIIYFFFIYFCMFCNYKHLQFCAATCTSQHSWNSIDWLRAIALVGNECQYLEPINKLNLTVSICSLFSF